MPSTLPGLTPEPLQRVASEAGQTLPADRRYAIENGPSGFDPAAPVCFAEGAQFGIT